VGVDAEGDARIRMAQTSHDDVNGDAGEQQGRRTSVYLPGSYQEDEAEPNSAPIPAGGGYRVTDSESDATRDRCHGIS
jgi:hypothetical protein